MRADRKMETLLGPSVRCPALFDGLAGQSALTVLALTFSIPCACPFLL